MKSYIKSTQTKNLKIQDYKNTSTSMRYQAMICVHRLADIKGILSRNNRCIAIWL